LTVPVGPADVVLVPVVHYHPGSAWAALRTLDAVRPEVVAVELPEGLARPFVQALPDQQTVARALVYHAEGDQPSRRQVVVSSLADAFVQAALWARDREVPVSCIDLPVSCDDVEPSRAERSAAEFPAPWAAAPLGDGYLEFVLANAAESGSPLDERNRQMAANLQRLAAGHGKIVAVVGAAHAEAIRSLLATGERLDRETPPALDVLRAGIDGLLLLRYYLGGLPALAAALDKWRRGARTALFDPRSAVENLVEAAATEYARDHSPVTVQQRIRFWNTVWCWVTYKQNVLPSLVELYRAARAVVNDEDVFAGYVAYHAIGFRLCRSDEHNGPLLVEGADEGMSLDVDGQLIPVRPPPHRPSGVLIPVPIDGYGQWWKPPPGSGGVHQARDLGFLSDDKTWDAQTALFDHVMSRIHQAGSMAVPWQAGALGEIDTRATLRGRAKADQRVYVRRLLPNATASLKMDSDPLVVLFDENFHDRSYYPFCLGVFSARDRYYYTSANLAADVRHTPDTTVYHLLGRVSFVSPHLMNFDIALKNKSQSAARRWFGVWLKRDRNETHIPTHEVFSDTSLCTRVPHHLQATARHCPPWEWMTMAAVLFARRRVVYVARRPPALWLQSLARHCGIRIHVLQSGDFPEPLRKAASTYVLRLSPRNW